MIKNRLAVLMAERGLKITRVAKDTGISRNTITSTSQNDGEMIRLETINTLCKYLGVTPSDFFEFEPIDINFSMEVVLFPFTLESNDDRRILRCDKIDADLFMDITWGHQNKSFDLSCELVSKFSIKENMTFLELVEAHEADNTITLKIEFDEDDDKEYFVSEIYNNIDSSFYKDIYNSLRTVIKDEVNNKIGTSIDHFIEKQLDIGAQSNPLSPFQDNFFASDLERIKKNINIEIISDVIKQF